MIFALCTVPAVLLRCFATYLFLVMMLGIIDLPQSMLTTSMFYWQSVVVISACLGLAANLLISTKPPSEGLPKRSEFMRKAIRLSALIAFVSHWGILFGHYGPASWVVGLGLAVPLVMAFKLTYLSHLASLIPKESLKRSCAGVRTIFVPALVAMFFVWDLFVLRAGISLGDDEWGIIILPVLLWLMAGGAWYILLLVRFYQALTVVALESRGLETTELKCDDQINTS